MLFVRGWVWVDGGFRRQVQRRRSVSGPGFWMVAADSGGAQKVGEGGQNKIK